MKKQEIGEYIELIKKKSLPECPHSVEANVLRRLRNEKKDTFWIWFNTFLPKNAFIAASLAMILITSSFVSIASSIQFENKSIRHEETIGALGFNYFHAKDIFNNK